MMSWSHCIFTLIPEVRFPQMQNLNIEFFCAGLGEAPSYLE